MQRAPVDSTRRTVAPGMRAGLAFVLAAGAFLGAGCDAVVRLAGRSGSGSQVAPAAAPTSAEAEVVRIRDERVRGEGTRPSTELLVRLPGVGNAGLKAARVVVKTAVDDLGTSLLPRGAPPGRPRAESVAPGGLIVVALSPAPRAATLVRELAVEVQVELAEDDPSSLVTVPGLLAEAGNAVSAQALLDAGVELRVLSREEVAQARGDVAEKRRAEGESAGLGAELREAAARFAAAGVPEVPDGGVALRVFDPRKRVRELSFLDGLGTPREARREERRGLTLLSCADTPVAADWSLVVRLRHAKSMQRYAFRLVDVPLP